MTTEEGANDRKPELPAIVQVAGFHEQPEPFSLGQYDPKPT